MNERAMKVLTLAGALIGAFLIYNKVSEWNAAHRTLQAKVFSAEVIEASTFRIMDKDGNSRGSLGVADSGEVYLTLYSQNRDASILLRVNTDDAVEMRLSRSTEDYLMGTTFNFRADTNNHARFDILRAGMPTFGFSSFTNGWVFQVGAGYPRLSLRSTEDGPPRFRLFDDTGRVAWEAPRQTME